MLTLQRAQTADLPWVNQQYASVPFRPSTAQHRVLIARYDGVPAGLGRLIPLPSQQGDGGNDKKETTATAWELGGIYVQPAYRGKGVARDIVQGLLALARDELGTDATTTTMTIWCLPFGHLLPFYTSCGLQAVSRCSPDIPDCIRATLGDCCATFPDRNVGLLKMDLRSDAMDANELP
jgi:GNAT superfamily N-acetyltransferase